jgi:hypothetical protein
MSQVKMMNLLKALSVFKGYDYERVVTNDTQYDFGDLEREWQEAGFSSTVLHAELREICKKEPTRRRLTYGGDADDYEDDDSSDDDNYY